MTWNQPTCDCEQLAGCQTIQSRVARLLIERLAEECASYCILTGYDDFPDRVDTDIDFMVGDCDFQRIPALIDRIAIETGTRLFQVIPHEISGRAFRLAATSEAGLAFIQPDSCSDYRHFGKLWLDADEVLAVRRRHPRGFWIPSPSCEFIYYLVKRMNKRSFRASHGAKLSQLFNEEPEKAKQYLRRYWKAASADALTRMAESDNWERLIQNIEYFRRELRRHPFRATNHYHRLLHAIDRILHPTGAWIALIGPDGCGKSTLIQPMADNFSPAFQKVAFYHLRPKSLPARASSDIPVTDPHGQPVRGRLYSCLKVLYLFADYWLGYLTSVRPQTVRTGLVIFDRYFYDIAVDPKRIGYGGPGWLLNLLNRFMPRPELTILLNASPEVLWSRKQEVSYGEIVRQHREYLALAGRTPGIMVIDAAAPSSRVIFQAREAILNHFSNRTRRRLGLRGIA